MDIDVKPLTNNYVLNSTHPLQPNSNQYMTYRKYVSIHSGDRNILSFPKSSSFEIVLPQTIDHVCSVSLYSWDLPSKFDVFTEERNNKTLYFSIPEPYKPTNGILLDEAIYSCLLENQNNVLKITISSGFYKQEQMVTELTNRMNTKITELLDEYVKSNPTYSSLLPLSRDAYNRFVVVYNSIKENIWFGNTADKFVLNNETAYMDYQYLELKPTVSNIPDFSYWGLPSYIGLKRTDSRSIETGYVRFFYGDVHPGDDGYWLNPSSSLGNSNVYYIEAPNKVNLMGSANIYLRISGLNIIDITQPFSINNKLEESSNTPNGIISSSVNYALSKITLPRPSDLHFYSTNLPCDWPVKTFNPPASRIRKLRISLRYNDDTLVDFNNFEYSFMLRFDVLNPEILKKGTTTSYNNPLVKEPMFPSYIQFE